jgi:hypothetical protein
MAFWAQSVIASLKAGRSEYNNNVIGSFIELRSLWGIELSEYIQENPSRKDALHPHDIIYYH